MKKCKQQLQAKQDYDHTANNDGIRDSLEEKTAFWTIMKTEMNDMPAQLWYVTDVVWSDLKICLCLGVIQFERAEVRGGPVTWSIAAVTIKLRKMKALT